MLYKLANVKISVKTSFFLLNNVIKIAECKKITFKKFANFIVLKSKYTYILFKSSNQKENHINITKIPCTTYVTDSVNFIINLLDCEVFSVTIDNIIATSNILCDKKPKLIDIIKNKLFENIKYNNEKFPGLFIKLSLGRVILFPSGMLVLLGCKKESDIECLIQNICAIISTK